jgi:hypothetical protein
LFGVKKKEPENRDKEGGSEWVVLAGKLIVDGVGLGRGKPGV